MGISRTQCAAAFGRACARRQKSGLPWCQVPFGQRRFRFGEYTCFAGLLIGADRQMLMVIVQGGVGNRVTARSKYGTKKPKLDQ